MRRVMLDFVPGIRVEFVDREVALRQLNEIAESGTRFPLVMYGPEGCGKTALLRQAFEVLREHGYSVAYVSPAEDGEEGGINVTEDLKELLSDVVGQFGGRALAALVEMAIRLVSRAMRRSERVALLADDVFQAVGLDKAELLVKRLLNMIEHPQHPVDRIVVIVGSSEGVTRRRIGRHSWAMMMGMWNMPHDGFAQLYDALPSPKPPLDVAWTWTGGNPRYLGRLYVAGWRPHTVVKWLASERELDVFVRRLTEEEREVLREALDEPDVLLERYGTAWRLVDELIELNLVSRVWGRDHGWIDEPPPERDEELGVGMHYAWQTPLHREAVRDALASM